MPDDQHKVVYVPNKGEHDYSAAWDFGEVVFCTAGTMSRTDIPTMYSELSKAMESAEPDDYILMTSLTSLCSIACSIFASKFGRLNLLMYERGRYIERSVHILEATQPVPTT